MVDGFAGARTVCGPHAREKRSTSDAAEPTSATEWIGRSATGRPPADLRHKSAECCGRSRNSSGLRSGNSKVQRPAVSSGCERVSNKVRSQLTRIDAADRLFSVPFTRITSVPEWPFRPRGSCGDPLPCREVVGLLWGSGRPGMEHQVPQLPELMTTFRVTRRHRGGLPARGDSARNADSLLLDALDPCRRVECLSAGSVARAAPAVGRRRAALVTERDHHATRTSSPGPGAARRTSCSVSTRRAYCEDCRHCSG